MGEACPAKRYPPKITGKPDEFISGGTNGPASFCFLETADIEYDPMGVGKCMLMRTVHCHSCRLRRDGIQALPAEVKGLLLFLFLPFFGFFGSSLGIPVP